MSLIHVAIAIFVITAFSAFVLDQGVMLLGRGQAQNVADAAALAGVTTRVKEEPGDTSGTVPAANGDTAKVIQQSVGQHAIFGGTAANTGKTWSWTCPPGITGWCVKVDVYRDGTNSSTTLPVYFANLIGVGSQKTRATATAVAKSVNGTRCLKPWLIPDKWNDVTPDGNYNPPTDVYRPYNYSTNTPGTGWSLADIGTTVLLHGGPGNGYGPSFYFAVGPNSGSQYQAAIEGCTLTAKIGDTINSSPGGKQGPTNHGVNNLIANGPVEVIVGMFSPQEWLDLGSPTGNFDLTIVNMMSIRITAANNHGEIFGVITGGVADDMGPGPTPTGTGSMIRTIQLVR